ncbi:MAG: ABC-F family ATP-binding cassette domain-containing protein [Thermoleophilia bacterium]|nr:ABC-F family ATP-binding cassette domain-containing protein [Thermoleophilia bacterium]
MPDPGTITSGGALVATDITHAYGDHVVLDDISLTAAPERRLGLVGDNGSGKSTLLRLLAGIEEPTSGTITRPPETALLEQSLPHPPETTIGAIIEEALAELRDLARLVGELSELVQRLPEDAGLAREYGDALEAATDRQAWDADHRVDRVLRGLGLEHFPRARAIGELSGGERARVAMAALLVRQPRALLLDEPTNHLDDAGMEFLERHLGGLPGVVIVSSHDRAFLDAVCTDILDIDPSREGVITRFGGTFTEYLSSRRRDRIRWERAHADQQVELAALATSISELGGASSVGAFHSHHSGEKMGAGHRAGRVDKSVARRVRNARRRHEALERNLIAQPPTPLKFRASLGRSAEHDQALLRVTDIELRGRLAPTSFTLEQNTKLLVTGPNGAGKSTLLGVLASELTPSRGTIEHLDGMRVGILRQDTTFTNPNRTPRSLYAEAPRIPGAPSLVDLGLLHESDLDRPVGVLSEGQQRRVALALLIAEAPELLLLDEPTNHLSPTLVGELEAALLDAPCAVVIATHDRWLRSRWEGLELRM